MKPKLPPLAWNDYLKTGIDIIDQQHRGLVDLYNETAEKLAAAGSLSLDDMGTLLGFLVDYAATHFRTEEALMVLGGIAEKHVTHHRESHAGFLKQVNAMVEEVANGTTLSDHQLMDFLGNWLIYHMLGEDQELARQLRPQSLAEPTPPASPLAPPAQEAAKQSLSRLYAFMARRNAQLQETEQAQRSKSTQMMELVAERSAELAASEERFRALFHNGSLPVIISRLEQNLMPGLILEVNPAACQLLGYRPDDMLRLPLLNIVAPDERARLPLLINELLITGKFECEMTYLTKSGEAIRTRLNMAQFVMHGQPVVMSILQDLSRHRAAQLTQAAVRQQASRLAQLRSNYLANVMTIACPVPEDGPDALSAPSGPDPARIAASLARQALFRDLPASDQALLAAASTLRRLQKGDLLFRKGDLPQALYLVLGGYIVVSVTAPQGGKKALGIFSAPQSIGETEIAMDSPYPFSAEATDDAEVLLIGKAVLVDLLDRDNRFARRLMTSMGARQHNLVQDMESYTLRSGLERVIGYLLQHASVHPGGKLKVELPATKQLIASLLHLKPETLSRIFRELSEAGLIHVRGKHVQIPDIEQLIAYQTAQSPES